MNDAENRTGAETPVGAGHDDATARVARTIRTTKEIDAEITQRAKGAGLSFNDYINLALEAALFGRQHTFSRVV